MEQALKLPAAVPAATPLGTRDTFAFEEGRILARVGEAADCGERDPATGLVTLVQGATASIPLRIGDEFSGEELEIRATEPITGVVHSRLRLKNSTLE